MATLAAEFPNDNPAIHGGVIWVCLDVTSAPVAERTAAASPKAAPEPEPEPAPEAPLARPSGIFAITDAPFEIELDEATEDEIVVEEMSPFDEAAIEMVAEDVPTPEPTVEIAVPPASEDPFLVLVAVLGQVAIAQGSPSTASEMDRLAFEDPSGRAWAAILRGTTDDWNAIGNATLDDWAAGLLGRALGAPDRVQLLKRELRARGVAAFGLIEAA